MNILAFFPIATGVIGGLCLGYLFAEALAFRLGKSSPSPRIVYVCSSVGAIVMLLPAFFLSFVVGGNLGSAWAGALTAALGYGAIGIPFGLALGIAVLLGGGLAVGSLVGALIGKLLANVQPH